MRAVTMAPGAQLGCSVACVHSFPDPLELTSSLQCVKASRLHVHFLKGTKYWLELSCMYYCTNVIALFTLLVPAKWVHLTVCNFLKLTSNKNVTSEWYPVTLKYTHRPLCPSYILSPLGFCFICTLYIARIQLTFIFP